ncbi:MAG TPA: type II toxin-antitoxin system prevent-host-death family antitoxin [Acetobacteraceae bacterium]
MEKEPAGELDEVKRRLRQAAARLYAQHGAGAISRRQVARVAERHRDVLDRLYPTSAGLLMAVLGEHLWSLGEAVCAAFDTGEACGPRARLEAVVRAWMERVSAEPDEHRSLLFCAHVLPEDLGRQVTLKYRGVLETVMEAVCAAVPGLSGRAEAVESLLGTARALLSDAGRWREGVSAEEQGRVARRIAGMLIAAGEAEMIGGWEGMGGLAGVGAGGLQVAESHVVRKRFSTVMDVVEAGGEVVVTRRGKRVAKVVGVG